MEKVDIRYKAVNNALARLESSLLKIKMEQFKDLYDELRDSTIQRFEFCVDTLWKYLREYLQTNKGVVFTVVSPKSVF